MKVRTEFDSVKIADGSFVNMGHEVINLSTVWAVVMGLVENDDGDDLLLLRGLDTDGKLMPASTGQWAADPLKCRKPI